MGNAFQQPFTKTASCRPLTNLFPFFRIFRYFFICNNMQKKNYGFQVIKISDAPRSSREYALPFRRPFPIWALYRNGPFRQAISNSNLKKSQNQSFSYSLLFLCKQICLFRVHVYCFVNKMGAESRSYIWPLFSHFIFVMARELADRLAPEPSYPTAEGFPWLQ